MRERDRRLRFPAASGFVSALLAALLVSAGCSGVTRQVEATPWGPAWQDCRQRTDTAYDIGVIGVLRGDEAKRDALTAVCMSASGWKRVYPGIAFAYPNYVRMTPEEQEAWLTQYGASHPVRPAEGQQPAPLGVATVNGWEIWVSSCAPDGSVACQPITVGSGVESAWETLAARSPGRPFPRRWFLVGEADVCERYRSSLRATGILSLPCTGPLLFQRQTP